MTETVIINNQPSQEQEMMFVVTKSIRVPEKNYGEVLSILNNTDYIDKRNSIRRKEVRFDYHQGRVLLQHTFPISLLSLCGFSRGDGTSLKSVRFSEDEKKDREITSKLSAVIDY